MRRVVGFEPTPDRQFRQLCFAIYTITRIVFDEPLKLSRCVHVLTILFFLKVSQALSQKVLPERIPNPLG